VLLDVNYVFFLEGIDVNYVVVERKCTKLFLFSKGLNIFLVLINMSTFRFSPSKYFFSTFSPPKVFDFHFWSLI